MITLFMAGGCLYYGTAMGTVEAALTSREDGGDGVAVETQFIASLPFTRRSTSPVAAVHVHFCNEQDLNEYAHYQRIHFLQPLKFEKSTYKLLFELSI